jgi:hypothetical protein
MYSPTSSSSDSRPSSTSCIAAIAVSTFVMDAIGHTVPASAARPDSTSASP